MKNLIPNEFPFPEYEQKTYADVLLTCIKMNQYFREHDSIAVSVSGGSDSDCIVHLVCKYFPEYLNKIRFVFVNTGLEYDATKRHLCDIEKRYGITIERIRGMSIVTAVRKYGVPILSKTRSDDIHYYLQGNQWAIDRIDGESLKDKPRYSYTQEMKDMIHYIRETGIKISAKCCYYSKKAPFKKFMRKNKISLNVTGERRAENGQRASAHKTCFEQHSDGINKYMPLWWWSDTTKKDFKNKEGIIYSDCYEVYGMTRTGCVGCPFNLDLKRDLATIKKYEPNLFKACIAVFGISYDIMDRFKVRKRKRGNVN